MSYDLINRTSPMLAERLTDDPTTIKTAQSTVTLAYQANIAGNWHNVTVMWCKNLMNHSLNITIDNIDTEFQQTCKIDLKAWYFWSRKGLKSIELDSHRVDVYWDFKSAKFGGSPEPCSDYYVALVSNEEVILLLGDYNSKAYKRTQARPALQDPLLFYKKENVFAKKAFLTRAKFGDRAKEHEITVDSSIAGSKDPELWISVDGVVLIHVKNLHWKFRGNQTVVVNKQKLQEKFPAEWCGTISSDNRVGFTCADVVSFLGDGPGKVTRREHTWDFEVDFSKVFWDVHDWLFRSPGVGHGLFIFKPVGPDAESLEGSGRGAVDSDGSSSSKYYATRTGAPEFCLYLYAWKIE